MLYLKASYSWQEEVRSQTVNKKTLKSSEADSTKCDWKTSASVFQRERQRAGFNPMENEGKLVIFKGPKWGTEETG